MAKRIQRKRTKGWKMPEGAVYVGRPGIFGNPFKVSYDFSPLAAVGAFRRWLNGAPGTAGGGLRRLAVLARINELRGKDLACFCPLNQPCHADVLLEIANASPEEIR